MAGGGCRPDSVPRRVTSIHLGRALPRGSSNLPGDLVHRSGVRGQASLGPPIRSCSAWGLPCPLRLRRGGALLPHPFTLTPGQPGGGLLSAALSLALPRPGVTRHAACRGVRTFLQGASPSGRPPPPAAPRVSLWSTGVENRLDRRDQRPDIIDHRRRSRIPHHQVVVVA